MLSNKISTESVRFAMYLVGVNLYLNKPNNIFTYVRFWFFCSCLALCNIQMILFSIFNRDDFYSIVIPAVYVSITTVVIVNMTYFFLYQEHIRNFLNSLDNHIYVYPDEENIDVNFQWPFRRNDWSDVNLMTFMYECTGFILSGSSPFIGLVVFGKASLIYPGWYPWDINPRNVFLMTYASQVVIATSVLWACYLVQLYIVFVTVEFLREFKKLRTALKTINERTRVCVLKGINVHSENYLVSSKIASKINTFSRDNQVSLVVRYNEVYIRNLICCFEHHKILLKIFDSFRSWFEIYYTVELTGSMMTFALVFYCLVEVEAYERLVTLIGVTLLGVTNLFSRCFIGEVFSEINEKVADTIIYKTNWYDQALRIRRMLLIFHLQTSKPLDLFGVSIFRASFLTFAAVSRLSYSYLNLIRASLNKK